MSRSTVVWLAAALGATGVVIWLLLIMGWSLGWWLLGGFLVGHGCVHLFFVMPDPTRAAAAGKRFGLNAGETRMIGTTLIGTAALGFLFAALTTVVPSGLWPILIVVSSLASLAVLAFFFSRQLILGVVVDVVLLVVAVTGVWRP